MRSGLWYSMLILEMLTRSLKSCSKSSEPCVCKSVWRQKYIIWWFCGNSTEGDVRYSLIFSILLLVFFYIPLFFVGRFNLDLFIFTFFLKYYLDKEINSVIKWNVFLIWSCGGRRQGLRANENHLQFQAKLQLQSLVLHKSGMILFKQYFCLG